MERKQARAIPYYSTSAQALLEAVGSVGAVFDFDVVAYTSSTSLTAVLVKQVVLPNSAGIFVETFREDLKDYPDIINVDHHQITLTNSGAFIQNLQFHGYHRPYLPSSLSQLPHISSPSSLATFHKN